MKIAGSLMLFAGLILAAYALGMDTAIQSEGIGRVNNIGLMNDKQNYLILASAISIVGALFFLLSDNVELKKSKYYEYFDLGRIQEINGNNDEAIKHYNACLYYLENHSTDGIVNGDEKVKIKKRIEFIGG